MARQKTKSINPLLFPILFFGIAIMIGTGLLYLDGHDITLIDALFTATSATCVTGLAVVDTGTSFSRFGQGVILFLIQIGGLGVMTLASLALYLLRRKVSLTDRLAVGQSLLHDASFHLGRFMISLVFLALFVECVGAYLLFCLLPGEMSIFSSFFHSVSAFCNAGFSLYPDSLMRWQDKWWVNIVFMGLIILGGIGFSVQIEVLQWLKSRFPGKKQRHYLRLSWYSRVVLSTSLALIAGGAFVLFCTEFFSPGTHLPLSTSILTSLFQSVTCRTAGFNTVDINNMTNISLLVMMVLMLVGGAPGSTAGGIKVTTLRVMISFYHAHLVGRRQVVIGNIAASRQTVNRALALTLYTGLLVVGAVFLLDLAEGGGMAQTESRGLLLEIVFEVTSALGTAGLSTGLTSTLGLAGKFIVIALMFIGRLGPLVFLTVLQEYKKEALLARPEGDLLIG